MPVVWQDDRVLKNESNSFHFEAQKQPCHFIHKLHVPQRITVVITIIYRLSAIF